MAFDHDIILLDVMMPGIDGPTSLGKLRDSPGLEKTPVIFLTAKVMPAEVEQYISMGAIGFITKPFDTSTICAEIESLWDTAHSYLPPTQQFFSQCSDVNAGVKVHHRPTVK